MLRALPPPTTATRSSSAAACVLPWASPLPAWPALLLSLPHAAPPCPTFPLPSLQPPAAFNRWQENEDMISLHLATLHAQLQQTYVGMALAAAAGRTFILPKVGAGPLKRPAQQLLPVPLPLMWLAQDYVAAQPGACHPCLPLPNPPPFSPICLRACRLACPARPPAPQLRCYCEKTWYGTVRCRIFDAQGYPLPITW